MRLSGGLPIISDAFRCALDRPSPTPKNELMVSACVAYEIEYKQALRRMPPFPERLETALRRDRIDVLPISLAHASAAAGLPGPHRDPWDRIMIAQAKLEMLTVITVDQVFDNYGVPTLW